MISVNTNTCMTSCDMRNEKLVHLIIYWINAQ